MRPMDVTVQRGELGIDDILAYARLAEDLLRAIRLLAHVADEP